MAKKKPTTKPQEVPEETDEDGFPVSPSSAQPTAANPAPEPEPEVPAPPKKPQETLTVAKAKEPAADISKADAVRAAIAAGVEEPKKGVEFIREKFGIEVSAATFSVTKSQDKKKAGGTGAADTPAALKAPRAPRAASAAPKASTANGSPSDMLRAVKQLVATYGTAEVRNVLDLLED